MSVVYAREMTAGITDINMAILTSFLEKRKPDSTRITKDLEIISNSLRSEKSNLTEVGEDKIVAGIDAGITEYRDSVIKYLKSPVSNVTLLYLQHKSGELYQHLQLLSEINGKAVEIKTDDAKIASKRALSQMTILASVCFLIGMSFTFSFASYFNQRFLQLYRGIKEIVSRDSDSRLFFDGKDEFYEISLIINEMAEKLTRNKQKIHVTLQEDPIKDTNFDDVQELKRLVVKIKNIEEQAAILISKLEQK